MSVRAAGLLASAALLLVAGCTGGGGGGGDDAAEEAPTSATATPTAAPPVERPAVDACYPLSLADAVAPTSDVAPAGCGQGTTSVTYEVGRLPAYVDGHLLAVDAQRVQGALGAACRRNLADYLGTDERTVRLSVVRPVWFSPTVEQSDAGADWYRCDVIAVVEGDQLGPLPATLRDGFADGAGSLALCGRGEPGTEGFARVACGVEHGWEATDVVDLGDGYPGAAEAEAAGAEPCQEAARERAADVLDYQWGYEWPTEEQWAAGQTYGICWAPA